MPGGGGEHGRAVDENAVRGVRGATEVGEEGVDDGFEGIVVGEAAECDGAGGGEVLGVGGCYGGAGVLLFDKVLDF